MIQDFNWPRINTNGYEVDKEGLTIWIPDLILYRVRDRFGNDQTSLKLRLGKQEMDSR
jgi:hypothetical protein